jgi:hypothetical protein
MATLTFDTRKFIRRLQEAGFSPQQAEAVAEAFRDAQGEAELATKRNIEDLRRDMKEIELRLTIKLGAMLTAAVAITAALVKLL